MITQEQFQELLSFEPTAAKVLSLYLSTDSGEESIEAIRLKAKNMLRDAGGCEEDVQAEQQQQCDQPGAAVNIPPGEFATV